MTGPSPHSATRSAGVEQRQRGYTRRRTEEACTDPGSIPGTSTTTFGFRALWLASNKGGSTSLRKPGSTPQWTRVWCVRARIHLRHRPSPERGSDAASVETSAPWNWPTAVLPVPEGHPHDPAVEALPPPSSSRGSWGPPDGVPTSHRTGSAAGGASTEKANLACARTWSGSSPAAIRLSTSVI